MKARMNKFVAVGIAVLTSMAISLTAFAADTVDPNAEALAQYYAALEKQAANEAAKASTAKTLAGRLDEASIIAYAATKGVTLSDVTLPADKSIWLEAFNATMTKQMVVTLNDTKDDASGGYNYFGYFDYSKKNPSVCEKNDLTSSEICKLIKKYASKMK